MTTRVHPTTQTGTRGELKAAVIFADLGWAPPAKLSEDIGTDFITFARDAASPEEKAGAWDLGAPVCLQIKGSPDEYLTPKDSRDGQPGWWFAESETYHFDHWLSFGLPYLLVLVDVTNQVAYWTEVNGEAIVSTGKGRKIFVPAAQRVDTESLDALNKIAISRRRHTLEGAAWNGKLNDLGPAERLRNALVQPRLVAPHPNKTTDKLTFEEAAAMIIRNRYSELGYRAGQGQCPKPEEWETHRDWGWRFVHALHDLLRRGASSKFLQLAAEARHRFERDACLIVHACGAYTSGNLQEALATLAPSRATKPGDRGWHLAHRAAFLLELDEPAEASDAAKKALVALSALDGDLSVSVIRGAAASILYTVAGFAAGDVESTVKAQDNAGAWWRAQEVSWALERDLRLRFEDWADTNTAHFVNKTPRDDLTATGWNAAFSASWGSWRHLATLNAHLIFTSTNDTKLLAAAMSRLVFIGDKKAAKAAARKVWMDGPIKALYTLLHACAYEPWPKRQEGPTMAVLSEAGDLLDPNAADNVVQRIIDLLETDGSVRVHGAAWSYRWNEIDGALRRVLGAGSEASHTKVADLIARDLAECEEPAAASLLRVATALSIADLGTARTGRLVATATARSDQYGVALLEILARDSTAAVAELRRQADAGDTDAIRSLLIAGSTDPADYIALGRSAARTVRQMVQNASGAGGTTKMTAYSTDPLDDLTLAALNTNDTVLWKEVTDALGACVIEQTQQQRAVRRLASQFENLPPQVQRALRRLAPSLNGPSLGISVGSGRNEFPAAVSHLRVAAGTIPDLEVEALLLKERRTDPIGFVRTLGAWNSSRKLPFLATMIVDDSPRVRAQAGFNMIRHVHAFPEDRDRTFAIIRAAQRQDSGCSLADGIAQGLAEYPDGGLADVEAALRSHPSALVRGRFADIP